MEITEYENLEHKIYTIRGLQVMLDTDLSFLFQVETKVLNQAVKRNLNRFPETFRFQLSEDDFNSLKYKFGNSKSKVDSLRSQSVTLESQRGKHKKYLPYAFTEQGVAMLSAVLRSEVAVKVSIQIMQAFVNMRHFLLGNASVFQRLDRIEMKQLQTDEKFEQIFKALEAGQPKPDKGIFFEGQIFDAYIFVAGLIKNAQKEIVLVDNYVDETVLNLLTKRAKTVKAIIYTRQLSKQLQLDLDKHNARGFQERNIRRMMQFAELFSDFEIVSQAVTKLSWSHFKELLSFKEAEYKGQMELYLRWLEKNELQQGEEQPLGLILCAEGNNEQIELLQLEKAGIKVAEYLTELPDKQLLKTRLHKAIKQNRMRIENNTQQKDNE